VDCLKIDFLTEISTFLYDVLLEDEVDELYVVEVTVLDTPV
jgi:hypothetical protein